MPRDQQFNIYLETGKKKVFACTIDWPGWCRSGSDEVSAIQALLSYAPRYFEIIKTTALPITLPQRASNFAIIERVMGNYATDYGVPVIPISGDSAALDESQVQRFTSILQAAWQAFDHTVELAEGKPLRMGPRGGGRELAQIVDHVSNAERGYLRHLGYNPVPNVNETIDRRSQTIHNAVLNGIQSAFRGQLPQEGPRGGKHWPLPYFIRRVAWHVVDHAWEIEDRVILG